MIAKILRLPVLTVEATLACDCEPERAVYQVIARHTVERRVLGSNHRRSVFTHTLALSYPLGFGDSQPDEAKWTSHGQVLHDPLDRLFQALRATRYGRLHHSRLWVVSDRTPYFPAC
jgi:hypothetical protein